MPSPKRTKNQLSPLKTHRLSTPVKSFRNLNHNENNDSNKSLKKLELTEKMSNLGDKNIFNQNEPPLTDRCRSDTKENNIITLSNQNIIANQAKNVSV